MMIDKNIYSTIVLLILLLFIQYKCQQKTNKWKKKFHNYEHGVFVFFSSKHKEHNIISPTHKHFKSL